MIFIIIGTISVKFAGIKCNISIENNKLFVSFKTL